MRKLALLAALLLTACAAPRGPALAPQTVEAAFQRSPSAAFDARWWQHLNDPVLERLLAAAHTGNLDVAQAVTWLRAARAGSEAQTSRLLPTVALNATSSDASTGLPESVKRGQPDTRALRASLDLQWELDLFGAVRAARRASQADAAAAAAAVEGARLLVQTELAAHYANWQSARLRLSAMDSLLDAQRVLLQLAERRAAEGQSSRLELEAQRAELASLDAQRSSLVLLKQHSEHRLALLTGRTPGSSLPELTDAPATLPAPPTLPAGQPVELLLRRPDLAALQSQADAAAARADAAQAERWPRLALQAIWGRQDLQLNGADLAPVPFRFAALAFAQPLFNAGRLKAVAEATSAQAEAARLAERQGFLTALAEVESSLAALHARRERESHWAAQFNAADRLAGHAASLHAQGLSGRSPSLAADKGRHAAHLQLLQARTQTLLDAFQLMKALGGSWNPSP
ncbi:MAG: TolC family protein [Inhella sp.]|uniref:TolC family protein n=1 Tax=Inhella sp. TaxID=1921806 RepID=UPI00391F02FF